MPMPLIGSGMRTLLAWVFMAAIPAVRAEPPAPTTLPSHEMAGLRADLQADRVLVQAGRPVWVTFSLTNLTNEPITLKVPDTPAAEKTPATVGLPVSHVFSGPRYTAVAIRDERGEDWDAQVNMRPRGAVPVVRLGAYGSVGLRVDLAQYYLSMKRPGKYTLVWRPYYAAVESQPLVITVLAERQAVILTELGTMTMRFYFDEAPNTVQNFLDLVDKRFYDRLTFHKIERHAWIRGGDPRSDDKGGRTDGKRVKAEFNKIPFETGTVGMARRPSDPDSASSQFFITASRQPYLDGNYTAFGYLVGRESFETLDKIASVQVDEHGRPRQPIVIRAITLENVPSREPDGTGGDQRNRQPTSRPAIITGGSNTPGPTSRPAAEQAGGRPAGEAGR